MLTTQSTRRPALTRDIALDIQLNVGFPQPRGVVAAGGGQGVPAGG